jgi:hypothetical protein
VAGGAAFAHGRVFEDVGFGLFAVAVAARFVDAGHGQAAVGFHDVEPVWIVAVDTVHVAFKHGVVLRQVELGVDGEVALETGVGLFARVDDELATTAAGGDVFAAGAVTGFAALLAGHLCVGQVESGMRAGREGSRDVSMAISAGFVADVSGAFDLRRGVDGAAEGGAGDNDSCCDQQQEQGDKDALHRIWALWVGEAGDSVELRVRDGGCGEGHRVGGGGIGRAGGPVYEVAAGLDDVAEAGVGGIVE